MWKIIKEKIRGEPVDIREVENIDFEIIGDIDKCKLINLIDKCKLINLIYIIYKVLIV